MILQPIRLLCERYHHYSHTYNGSYKSILLVQHIMHDCYRLTNHVHPACMWLGRSNNIKVLTFQEKHGTLSIITSLTHTCTIAKIHEVKDFVTNNQVTLGDVATPSLYCKSEWLHLTLSQFHTTFLCHYISTIESHWLFYIPYCKQLKRQRQRRIK